MIRVKKYILKFWKIISSFQKYSWLPLTPIIPITKLKNAGLKGRKHADVKFTYAPHVRA